MSQYENLDDFLSKHKITKKDEHESFKKNNSHNFIFYNPETRIINGINLK